MPSQRYGYAASARSRYHKTRGEERIAMCDWWMSLDYRFSTEGELVQFALERHSIRLTRCPRCFRGDADAAP